MLRHKEIQRYENVENALPKYVGRTQANNVNSNSLPPSANIQIHYCFLCPKSFYSTDHFNDHLARHRITSSTLKTIASTVHSTWWPNGKKIVQCKRCDQVFSTMAKLNEHYSPKNPNNLCASMRRSLENYSITNQIGFELHLELDSETETECIENEENNKILPYRCCMCSKSFKRKYQISQHQRSMHNYELLELKCERCFFRTVSQQVLDYHKISQCFNDEKKYQCDQCNFKFMWQDNLKKHISIFHPSNIFVKALDAVDVNTSNESRQIKNADNTNDQCLESEEDSQNTLAPALHKNDLEHIRRNTCDKSHKCDLCDITFITISSLKKHQQIHTGDRPYKCMVCEKSFKQKGTLRAHERLHNGERPYRCTICAKSFRQASHVSYHMRRYHSGEKPDMCEIDETRVNKLLATPDKSSDSTRSTRFMQRVAKKKQLCTICGSYVSNLKIHIRSHKDERPFKCTICDKSFVFAYLLKSHMRNHTGERPYECAACEKKFMNSAHLKEHSRIHTGYKRFTCEICSRDYRTRACLEKHRIKSGHHADDEKKYQCSQCNFKIKCQDDLKKHISLFHPSNMLVKGLDAVNPTTSIESRQIKNADSTNDQCLESEEDSQNTLTASLHKNDLEHIKRNKCDKSHRCDLCEMTFIKISSLKKHQQMHDGDRPFKCMVCEKAFKQKGTLRAHERLHNGERPYRCTICSKSFRQASHVSYHMRYHSSEGSTRSTRLVQKGVKNKLCTICGLYVRNLKLHIMCHTDERPFNCDLCDKTFRTVAQLNSHRHTHFTERPFKCTICDKSFVFSGVLKAHMRNHTGERPYECTVCRKKFMRLSTLRGHSLIHTGYAPFTCEICNQSFKRRACLERHRIKSGHHAETSE